MSLQRDLAKWRAFASSWTPKLRGSPGICGMCASSRLAIAVGLTADDPHELVHALVKVMVERAARTSAQYEHDYAAECDPTDYRAESAARHADRQLTFGLHAEAVLCNPFAGLRADRVEIRGCVPEGRIAAFSRLDEGDTAKTIDGDPLSTFHSHPNQLGFASYSYSPMAGAFSLFFGANAGNAAHIDRAELTCAEGTHVPFNVDSPPYAHLVAAPTGCRFLNVTVTDGADGMLDDDFDLASLSGGAES